MDVAAVFIRHLEIGLMRNRAAIYSMLETSHRNIDLAKGLIIE